MAVNAQSMLRQSLDSVVGMDVSLARKVLASDDEVDSDYHEMTRALREAIRRDPGRLDDLLSINMVCKHLERIADLATNIAEDAIYMVSGEIVRHGRHHVSDES
jgi:phosphate transport system protein